MACLIFICFFLGKDMPRKSFSWITANFIDKIKSDKSILKIYFDFKKNFLEILNKNTYLIKQKFLNIKS